MLISLHPVGCYGRKHLKSRSTIFTALPSFTETVISLKEAIRLAKYGFAFYKSTLTTPNDLPILYMLGNYFQDYYLFYVLSRDQDEADWPVVFWIFLFVLLEDRNVICFLPESWISLDHRDHLRMTENAFKITLSNYFSSHGCIPKCPTGLSMFSLFTYALTWNFYTKNKSSLLKTFPLVSVAQGSWMWNLPVKIEVKRTLSTSGFSMSFFSSSPVPFSRKPIFSLVFL